MDNNKNNLTPEQSVIENFKMLNTVPRGSNHEQQVSKLLMDKAKALGLGCGQDSAYNVVVVKPAQKTNDTRPVILQAHMDMVCAVDEAHKGYDFLNNPIYIKEEKETIENTDYRIMTGRGTQKNAKGEWEPVEEIHTTLGADDGIGVASILTILENTEMTHPPIIAIFTTGEEIGMVGAKQVQLSWVQSVCKNLDLTQARFINVDEEQDGRFCYGCAGGVGVNLSADCRRDSTYDASSNITYRLNVQGLRGGHSGIDIGMRRANAIRLIGRILYSFLHDVSIDLRLFSINGGSAENAIAASAECEFAVPEIKENCLLEIFDRVKKALMEEYHEVEDPEKMKIELVSIEPPSLTPIGKSEGEHLIDLLYLVPNDVLGFLDCDHYSVVETSANLGIITTNNDNIVIQSSVRSFYDARRDFVAAQIKRMAEIFGFNSEMHDDYSGWAQSQDSELRKIFVESYKSLFPGQPVEGRSVHAGLECGVFVKVFGNIDMIACGPTIKDVHTPLERLYVDTVPKIVLLLKEVLKRLSNPNE